MVRSSKPKRNMCNMLQLQVSESWEFTRRNIIIYNSNYSMMNKPACI